jgi:glycosyltransferase involved in cell wall biosynthesis
MIVSTTITNSRADVIGAALATIAPEVDLCIVIDTGATDDTMRIARDVLGPKLVARKWPWRNDFAAARNFALDAARDLIRLGGRQPDELDWIVSADTDEWLRLPGLREHLTVGVPDKVDVLMVSHHSLTYRQSRIFRATTPARWCMPVHEYLEGYVAQDAPAGWTFECQPRPHEDRTAKYEHYRAVLEALVEREPTNPRAWYYLGDTLAILGFKGSAVRAFDRCGKLPGWDHQACWARYRQAILLFELGLATHAIEAAVQGICRSPHDVPELYWLAGWISYQVGDWAAARDYAKGALRIGPVKRSGFCHPKAQKELPEQLLRWAEKQLAGLPLPGEVPPASAPRAVG